MQFDPHERAPTREIVFFTADVPDRQTLIDGLRPGMAHHVLSSEGDGFAEIATTLAEEVNIAALHIVSHGESGEVSLGAERLSEESLSSASQTFDRIRQTLSANAEVIFYGCRVAYGERGAAFIEGLRNSLDRDVVASEHPIGAAEKGGSWRIAPMQRELAFQPDAQAAYRGILANTPPVFDQDADNNGVLSDAEAGGAPNLTMGEDSGPLGLINFLQADDGDAEQVLNWSVNGSDGPDNGTITIDSGTVNTPATDDQPVNATYTPDPDFNGTDTFSIDVSDGTDTDTLRMTVTVTDAPDVISVDVADGSYGLGDAVPVSVTFDEAVTVTSGTPTIDIDVGGNTRTVNLDSGDGTTTLSGTYTIGAGDDDTDGIAIEANALSGTIEDSDGDGNGADLSNTATNDGSETVDATAPTVSAVSVPDAAARVGDTVTVNIAAGEAGLSLDTGTVNGVAVTGFADDGGGNYSATYTVQEGDADRAADDDIPVNVVLSDAAGNVSSGYTTAISQGGDAIDANSPAVVGAITPSTANVTDASVGAGTFTLTVNFDEAMDTGVDPTISFPTSGEDPTAATLSNASATWTDADTFTVTYDVADANEAVPDIDVRVSGAQDPAGNTLPGTTQNGLFSVTTAPAPVISTIDSSTADGIYKVGDSIDVTATFDQAVDFTAGTGELQATLSNGETITFANADFANQTGLSGTYTIGDGHTDSGDLDVTSVSLTGDATLEASDNGVPADTGLPMGNSLADNQALVIDANTPGVSEPDLDAASDSGTSDSDDITDIAAPTISGSTEAGATVTIRVGGSSVGTATADGAGDWAFTFAGGDLSEGENAVDIVASDAAGNSSNESDDLTLMLDTTAPALIDDTSASVMEFDAAGPLTGINRAGDNVTDNDTGADATAPVVAVNGNADAVGSAVAGDNGGLFTVAADGRASFGPNGDFDALATGDSETTGVTLSIRDAAGNTDTSTLSVAVTGANTAPTLTIGNAPTVNTGRTTTLDASLLNGKDPDDDGADLTYILTSVPGSGMLKLSGTALAMGDRFTQQDIIDGSLTFTAGSTAGTASFGVDLRDDSLGGPASGTISITIDDPPPPSTPDPEPYTIDGAPATVTRTVDPDTGNPVTEFRIEPATDGTRVNEDDATNDVDVDLSDGVRASISENLGLIATRRTDSSQDDLRALIDRPGNEDDTDRPDSREVDDFLGAVSPSTDVVTVTPTRSRDATGDERVTVQIAPASEDATTPVVVVDARQIDTADAAPGVDITGAGAIVVRGSGTFRGNEELADGGPPDVDNVLGDNTDQTLFFGPGDDIIQGGGGNDLVSSAGGNDQLLGNSGDDHVVGGTGNDTLDGGTGNDVLQGGPSDAGTWRFTLNEGELISRFDATEPEIATTNDLIKRGPWWTAGDSGQSSDSRLAFSYETAERQQLVSTLYKAATGELPPLSAYNDFVASEKSGLALAEAAVDHFVASQGLMAQALEVQVPMLIEAVWGEGAATDALVETGVDFLSAGGSPGEALLFLAQAPEAEGLLREGESTELVLVRPYEAGETGWSSQTGNDILRGGDGNDRLVSGDGADWLDGGAGTDVAVYTGSPVDFTFRMTTGNEGQALIEVTKTLSEDTHTLQDIELLEIGGQLYGPKASFADVEPETDQAVADHIVPLTGQAMEDFDLATLA